MMSWVYLLGLRVQRLAPNSIGGRTFFIEDDYIYRPKTKPTDEEIDAVLELGKTPSQKSVLIGLGQLIAFRPIPNSSESQIRIVMDNISRRIIAEGFSEVAVLQALDKLADGNSEFGGRNFPTREEIISAIRINDRKIKLLIKSFEADYGDKPKGYHADSTLDWLFDKMDEKKENHHAET